MVDVFNRLSASLSQSERQKFLEALLVNSHDSFSQYDTCEYHISYDPPLSIEEEISNLSFFERILIWLDKILSRRTTQEAISERLLRQLTKRVALRDKTITRDLAYVTDVMKSMLVEVANIARFFASAVDISKQEESAFYAFLGRVTLFDHYEILSKSLDATVVAKQLDTTDEQTIKENLDMKFEKLMENIDLRRKEIMLENAHCLYLLKALCKIKFENFFDFFTVGPNKNYCTTNVAAKFLENLSSILYAINFSGDSSLFEALYLFHYFVDGQLESVNDEALKRWIENAYLQLAKLGELVQTMGLRDVTACCLRQYNYKPELAGGGDDWFYSYKRFWKVYSQEKLKIFNAKVNFDKQISDCCDFLKFRSFPWLKYYGIVWNERYKNYPENAAALALDISITEHIKEKMSYYLKILISEGQFYKKQNHDELEQAYAAILSFPSLVNVIDAKAYHYLRFNYDSKNFILALEGEPKQTIYQDENENSINNNESETADSLPSSSSLQDAQKSEGTANEQQFTTEVLSSNSENEAVTQKMFLSYTVASLERMRVSSQKDFSKITGKLAREFSQMLSSVVNVLNGVLYGEVGGKFDTVSNLAYLGGSGRSQIFIATLKQFLSDLQSLQRYLEKIMEGEAKILSMLS